MKTIELTQGKVTLVDDDVYEWASKLKWHVRKHKRRWNAARNSLQVDGPRQTLLLHREILRPADDQEVDHINGDSLDNRRANLRSVSHQQNTSAFQRQRPNKTSKFRGVNWDKKVDAWRAQICCRGNKIALGFSTSEETAAKLYDTYARKFLGEFTQPNFPLEVLDFW